MMSIFLAIIFPVISVVLFKEFERYKINALHAIIVNYLGAIGIGLILFVSPSQLIQVTEQSWLLPSILVGFLFLLNFYLIAKATLKNGVSIATFSNKISLVFPVVFTLLYFNETLTSQKIFGIVLALGSIYLLTFSSSKTKINGKVWIYPLLIFFFTGILESIINATQKLYFTVDNEIGYFVISSFMISFLFGCLILIFQYKSVTVKSILAGFILSIPNTLGVYFFVESLNQQSDSTSVLPILHVGSLVLAILVGSLVYKENLTKRNWIGIALALGTIFLLSLT